MGILSWSRDALGLKENERTDGLQQPFNVAATSASGFVQSSQKPNTSADGWFMPKYKGRAICDWVDDVSSLKRSGDLPQALTIAQGCMEAMVEASRQNSVNVMEFYVTQVVIIQHKQKDYVGEIETIERWLALQLEPTRQDHRLGLQKRLAKARELLAKARGEDPSAHHAEWKHYLELEKAAKVSHQDSAKVSTGKSAVSLGVKAVPSRTRPSWVAPEEVLYSPSFVAVDFETANRRGGVSACQIELVKVSAGRVVDRASTLIKPPPGFDVFEFTYLHGISARDVRNAPMWSDIVGWVAGFHGGLPVYAHNAPFDAGVWKDLDSFYGTHTLPDSFFCSYRTTQRLVPGLENYKLPTVTKALVPGFRLNHHRADSDAEACALIVAALQSLR